MDKMKYELNFREKIEQSNNKNRFWKKKPIKVKFSIENYYTPWSCLQGFTVLFQNLTCEAWFYINVQLLFKTKGMS